MTAIRSLFKKKPLYFAIMCKQRLSLRCAITQNSVNKINMI